MERNLALAVARAVRNIIGVRVKGVHVYPYRHEGHIRISIFCQPLASKEEAEPPPFLFGEEELK